MKTNVSTSYPYITNHVSYRITNTSAVNGDFNVRKAEMRKYLYRFAIRKKKENVSIPPGYIHDWEPGIIKKYFPYRRPYSGGRNLTTLLPISDARYVAEIGYVLCLIQVRINLQVNEQSERGILIIAFYIVALILVSTRFVRL